MNKTITSLKSVKSATTGSKRWDRLELLERIDSLGSISAAASAMGMSYKAAWQAIEAVNNLSTEPIITRQTGGSHGGGTSLTKYGRRVLAAYRHLETEWKKVPVTIGKTIEDFDKYYRTIRRFDMRTSARNQFLSAVKMVKKGAVNAEVILDMGGGVELVVIITNDSVDHLALEPGLEVYALIKASWVILTTDDNLKTSARNQLSGSVARCQEGTVNSEVIIELAGGKTLTAIVTNESIQSLALTEGKHVSALINAAHIILAVPV